MSEASCDWRMTPVSVMRWHLLSSASRERVGSRLAPSARVETGRAGAMDGLCAELAAEAERVLG